MPTSLVTTLDSMLGADASESAAGDVVGAEVPATRAEPRGRFGRNARLSPQCRGTFDVGRAEQLVRASHSPPRMTFTRMSSASVAPAAHTNCRW